MGSPRRLSLATLCLILASSLLVLLLGIHFAKQEILIPVEQDQTPLSRFTSKFLHELESLDALYLNHLIEIQNSIGLGTSDIEIASICRQISGIEQATLLEEGERPRHIDLREVDRSISLPRPHRVGDGSEYQGITIDESTLAGFSPEPDHYWLGSSDDILHFVCKSSYNTILVLRINPSPVRVSAETWISQWIKTSLPPLEESGLLTSLAGPTGAVLGTTIHDEHDQNRPPDFLLPIPSRAGDWQLASWNKTDTVTSYHQPILIGSAALSVVLALAGVFGFLQQQRAIRLAEQRVSFVNRVSHELRTPMTNILLNTDLLGDALPSGDHLARKRLDLIIDEANRLGRLIENVLTFSRKERELSQAENAAQHLSIQPCELRPAIKEALSQFSQALSRNQICPKLNLPSSSLLVMADPDALRQIFSNLISNVEKYAAKGKALEISALSSADRESVSITFSDNGPGIPGEKTTQIFEPFERLDNSTTEGVSGTGLGLTIAQDLVHSMGGSLILDPTPSSSLSGAHFTLTLPAQAGNVVPIAS